MFSWRNNKNISLLPDAMINESVSILGTEYTCWVSAIFIRETIFCFCWGFTAQSTQWGHVESNQFTYAHFYWSGLVLEAINKYCVHSFARNWQSSFLWFPVYLPAHQAVSEKMSTLKGKQNCSQGGRNNFDRAVCPEMYPFALSLVKRWNHHNYPIYSDSETLFL